MRKNSCYSPRYLQKPLKSGGSCPLPPHFCAHFQRARGNTALPSGLSGRLFWAEVSYSCSYLPGNAIYRWDHILQTNVAWFPYFITLWMWVGTMGPPLCNVLVCALFSTHSVENHGWRQSSRRYQLPVKDKEYDVCRWNKHSKLYSRVMNLEAGLLEQCFGRVCVCMQGGCRAVWSPVLPSSGVFRQCTRWKWHIFRMSRPSLFNKLLPVYVCHLWNPTKFPGWREALKNARDADCHMVERG